MNVGGLLADEGSNDAAHTTELDFDEVVHCLTANASDGDGIIPNRCNDDMDEPASRWAPPWKGELNG